MCSTKETRITINCGIDLTDDITLYKGEFYEKISLFNYFII